MKYELKAEDGYVTFLMKANKDFVRSKMPLASAQQVVKNGTVKRSNKKDYPINVDDQWYFKGEPVKKKEDAE